MAKEDNKPLELRPPASPVVVDWPPSLANMTTGRYAISGGTWLRVPDDTAFEDLHLWMVVKPSEGKSEPTPGRTWTVQGSKGDEYTVTQSAGDSREIFYRLRRRSIRVSGRHTVYPRSEGVPSLLG